MNEKLKPCPFCGGKIDVKQNMYIPERDWHPTYYDPDSGGDPISIICPCGLEFTHGYDLDDFIKFWNRRTENAEV